MSGPATVRGRIRAWGRHVRSPAYLLLAVLLLLLTPGATSAHAQVVATDPIDGARLPVSPTVVTLTFNEPVTLAPGRLRVVRADGSLADKGEEMAVGTTVTQAIEPLADGWYVMAWSIISEDGHVVHGSATFAVGDADAAARPTGPSFASPLELALWVTRGVADLMLLIAAGAGVAWSLLSARTRRVRRLWLGVLAITVIAHATWLVVEAADGGASWLSTGYAMSGMLRLVLLGAALGLLWWRPARGRVAAALVLLGLVTLAWGGHATGSPLTSLTLATHLLAAVTWLGAAPAVALVMWDRSVADDSALVTVRGFSRLATVALVVLIAAGSASALLLTNGLEDGLTFYLWLVLAKVVVVAIAALLGTWGRRALTRRPDRNRYKRLFLVDTLLLVVVVMLSSALTLVGPHGGHSDHEAHVMGAPRCSMTVGEGAGSFGAAFVATPGRPGTNTLLVSGVPATAVGVSVELLHPYAGGAASVVPLSAVGAGWSGSAPLPFTGDWTVTVVARLDTFTEARGSCGFTVAP